MLIHPLLRLAATQPHLLGDHVEAYADLVGAELKRTGQAWGRQAAYYAIAAVLALVGLILAGTSVLLWAALPSSGFQAGWVLIALPAIILACAAIAWMAARSSTVESAFDKVKKQLDADMAVLREVSAA